MSTPAPAAQKTPLTELPAWRALENHYGQIAPRHLRELFQEDPDRGTKFTAQFEDFYLDYSKHRITDEPLKLLLQLADESGLAAHRDAMFAGEKINTTEGRAVLHIALRAPEDAVSEVDGENLVR